MAWLSDNWFWVLIGVLFVGAHLFGHGGHGHGRAHERGSGPDGHGDGGHACCGGARRPPASQADHH